MDTKDRIREAYNRQAVRAMARYNERYNNDTYIAATKDRTAVYANALIDEALALCGHPHYSVHIYRKWSKAALAHLANFVD